MPAKLQCFECKEIADEAILWISRDGTQESFVIKAESLERMYELYQEHKSQAHMKQIQVLRRIFWTDQKQSGSGKGNTDTERKQCPKPKCTGIVQFIVRDKEDDIKIYRCTKCSYVELHRPDGNITKLELRV